MIGSEVSNRDMSNDYRKQIINITLDKENKIWYNIIYEVSRVHINARCGNGRQPKGWRNSLVLYENIRGV